MFTKVGRHAAPLLAILIALVVPACASAAPTWTDTFPVGFDAYEVSMAPDGTTIYAGYTTIDGSPAIAAQIRPPGGPLGPVQTISTPGATQLGSVAVAAGPDSGFLLAWPEGGILQVRKLAPGAATFGARFQILTPQPVSSYGVLATVTGAGDGLILFPTVSGAPGAWSSALRVGSVPADGSTPTSQALVSVGPSADPTNFYPSGLAASDSGDAIAAWQSIKMTPGPASTTIDAVAFRKAGGGFATPITLDTALSSDNANLDQPDVDMTPSGTAAVVWGRRQSGTFNVYFRSGTAVDGLGSS